MGLRFRKTISLLPGVRLNLSKSGVGVSAGVPGLRGSINTGGRVTGTVGIPGTGVSYVKTKTLGSKSKSKDKDSSKSKKTADTAARSKQNKLPEGGEQALPSRRSYSVQIDSSTLKSIHNASDAAIDWKKVSASDTPPDDTYDVRTWAYLHVIAPKVMGGDIDTYLQLISEFNPLDDLLGYGDNFEFGTDNPDVIEVEFVINGDALTEAGTSLSAREYNLLLQDFVCSMALRIARDMFALLPIKDTIVHVVLGGATIFSADFDRANLSRINFAYIDPSNTATKFRNNMKFDEKNGFSEIIRL